MENFKHKLSLPMTDIIEGKWNEQYSLDQSAPFYLKFNDNHKLLKKMKTIIKNNEEVQKLYSYHHLSIEQLKKVKIWIRQEHNILDMNMFDVYSTFMKHLKDASYEDQFFNCNAISFIGPLGPFKDIPLISILNEEVIDKFIFSQLIKNKLPMRSLRVHTRGKIQIEYGEDFGEVANLEIKQVTDSGILFATKEDMLLNSIEKSEYVKFFIDTRAMNSFVQNNLVMKDAMEDEFFYTQESLRYFFIEQKNIIKSLSYKSDVDNEIFLFCRYPHMLESDVPNIFHDFVDKVKNYIDELAS